jgi:ABC-type multidrug transport system ATPase subunit
MIQSGHLVFAGPMEELLATSRSSVVAVAEDPVEGRRLAELVEKAGKPVEIHDGRIEVDADAEWSVEVGRLAMKAGIVLRELHPVEADLETTFLEMTNSTKDEGSS